MDKLVKRWEEARLLDDCKNEDEKLYLAGLLDNAIALAKNDVDVIEYIIPLIVRIFYDLRDTALDLKKIIEIWKRNFPLIEDLNCDTENYLDAEIEIISKAANEYIKWSEENG